jgi:hypothetical protein
MIVNRIPQIRITLEVNPFLTISALAERIVENIVASLTLCD